MRLLTCALAASVCVSVAAGQRAPEASMCRPVGRPQVLKGVPEASGAAIGRRGAGMLWTHNDSGKPNLFRFDEAGEMTSIPVTGAELRDWEDVTTGRCPSGECLYIADIGDNRGSRRQITVYRVPEPVAGSSATAPAEAFHAIYPDHPRDAEALLVTASEDVLIITKEVPPRLYRFPLPLKVGATSTLEFVRPLNERVRITGAAASPDGQWAALRSNRTLLLYRSDDLVDGRDPVRIDLSSLKEPQGEGVAFGRGGELYLVSEAGEGGVAGILTRLNCALPK